MEILSSIRSWIRSIRGKGAKQAAEISEESLLLWMNGLARSGKTTIAYTIASWCDQEKILGASFFCARTGGRSDVQLIFPTIAYQLCRLNAAFAEEVVKALDNNPDIHRSLPSVQLEKLIVKPLQAVKGTPFPDQIGRAHV